MADGQALSVIGTAEHLRGLPSPSGGLKLVPTSGCAADDNALQEPGLRGTNVAPGDHRQPALKQAAFDGESFYRMGDTGSWWATRKPRSSNWLRTRPCADS